LSLVALWALLFVALPTTRGETALGTYLAKLISSFGLALVLWAPVAGAVTAVRWARRKTH
jgi:hypothetical protein